MHIAFFAEQLYYLPQFSPVIRCLLARGHRVTTLLRLDAALRDMPLPAFETLVPAHTLVRVDTARAAYAELRGLAPDWAVFGSFLDHDETLAPSTRSALVYHGIGVKTVLFDPRLNAFDLRCVESQRVLDELVARDPGARARLALVGFAKLDPLFAGPPPDTAPHGAAPHTALPLATPSPVAEPVLLYAPTFYPSSLELMPKTLSALAPGARWIVKPHFFTWTVKQYAGQRERLKAWARDPAVEVLGAETYDLVPLMARADVLVSDASSALFEFAALGRPVVWCRFLKLRWSYRGLLRWRFDRRMDPNTTRYETVAHCVDRAADLPQALAEAIAERRRTVSPDRPEREALIEHLIGPRDGRASERIADELERRAQAGPPAVTARA
ncbi:CDP-glycerol glycerophosphotransferase family protein [Methylibium sp.]|uniref:CDP-glycerol glycerophosphotransferase family protein n=1 Tax=Methylibium sp. TaxID=2067992 RepID=UPI0018103749|nr:CDP-glycerol glycerophosphotransferase family protein [Methylibium sp.]MBA3591765.1 CDP-glycerol glycerophosphotransferase family protein [Methylibium sp.]